MPHVLGLRQEDEQPKNTLNSTTSLRHKIIYLTATLILLLNFVKRMLKEF